ncbi:MAG: VOC family protein [Dehalococcoidia bacterium]|nr:VOC family protein [Dehalococcoidia bacterium]
MISDVHHVGIAVRDMAAALRFYSEALGLPVVKEGDAPARGARVALIAAGGSYLELVQPVTDGSPFARHIEERGEGLHHVALRTEDVEALVASLREWGVPLEDEQPREGFTGRLSFLAPEAMDGTLLEVVQPPPELSGGSAPAGAITRIDHVVLRLPDVEEACRRMRYYFGVETKRTFERGETRFSFLRPGDVVLELIGPSAPAGTGLMTGFIAGLAFECVGIDALAADLKAKGYPIGEPHPALQGGRIVSVHADGPGVAGVPVAFIDFTDSHTARP